MPRRCPWSRSPRSWRSSIPSSAHAHAQLSRIRVRRPAPTATPEARREHRGYPFWARVTAALWLLVLGILIGGAAIPHAQDTPRVVPQDEDARFCRAPTETPAAPQ